LPAYLHFFPTRRSSDLLVRCVRFLFPFDVAAHTRPLHFFLRCARKKIFESYDQIFTGNFLLITRPAVVHLTTVNKIQFVIKKERSEEHTSELQSRENIV